MSVFLIMLLIGIAVPTFSLIMSAVFGGLHGVLHFFDFDFDADLGHAGAMFAFLPLSPVVWCVLLIVAGSVGETLSRFLTAGIVWTVALVAGYAAMTAVNIFILLPLKRADNRANDENVLVGKEGKIIEGIAERGIGAVRVEGKSGAVIYAAVTEQGNYIPQEATVRVVAIVDNVATVKLLINSEGGFSNG